MNNIADNDKNKKFFILENSTTTEEPGITTTEEPNTIQNCGKLRSGNAVVETTDLYLIQGYSGSTTFEHVTYSLPDRFIIYQNNTLEYDTGYVGSFVYDFGGLLRSYFNKHLKDKIDPVTGVTYPNISEFPDDGYPRVTQIVGTSTYIFNKEMGNKVKVKILAPLPDTLWAYTLYCPTGTTPPPTTTTTTTPEPTLDELYVNVSGDVMTGPLSTPELLANDIYGNWGFFTFLSAISATINYLNITEYELSGFHSTGPVIIDGIVEINNDLIVNGSISADGGTSQEWNSTFTTVSANSANWFETLPYASTGTIIAQPGDDLIAKYAEAKILTPMGNVLAANNRAALIILPGVYVLTAELVIDTEFVDIFGLGYTLFGRGAKPAVILSGARINISANDVRVQGIDSGIYSFITASNKSLQYIFACKGGNSESFASQVIASGTFINCVAGDNSFGGQGGTASGKFINCEGGNWSFGGSGGTTSGTFINCSAGSESFGGEEGSIAATARFIRCDFYGNVGQGADSINSAAEFHQCTGISSNVTTSSAKIYASTDIYGVLWHKGAVNLVNASSVSVPDAISAPHAIPLSQLESSINSISGDYVKIAGDTMTGALSTPDLSTGSLFVSSSSIYLANDAKISIAPNMHLIINENGDMVVEEL